MNIETDKYKDKQEHLYYDSLLVDKKWYREILGGHWILVKSGKDTPYIGMFCRWTKLKASTWYNTYELGTEDYPYTGVDTKYKLYESMIKRLFLGHV